MDLATATAHRNRSYAPGPLVFWGVACLVGVLAAYPPLASLSREGIQGAFRFFAADTFYYLSVADHSSATPFFTFDGIHPTNGFHPLWQIYLERTFAFFQLDSVGQVYLTAGTSIVLVTLGTILFSLVVLRLTGRPWLALVASVPGFYYLGVPTLNAHHFAQWSFANGMESPLSITFFGLLLAGVFLWGWLDDEDQGRETRSLLFLSATMTAVVLSRLDDVFIFIPFGLWVLLHSRNRMSAVRRVVTIGLIPLISIGAYLLYNVLNAETVLPSSGAAKAQPLWAFLRNLYALWTTTLPFADPLGREVAGTVWKSEAWRILQMLVPAGGAVAWLLCRRISWTANGGENSETIRRDSLLSVFAAYALLKATYNFTMVGLWNQGQWYYPLSIMTFNLLCATWFASLLDRYAQGSSEAQSLGDEGSLIARLHRSWPRSRRLGGALPLVLVVGLVLVSANGFIDLKERGGHQARNFEFWLERDATQKLLESECPDCGVLAFDDGIVSYSLDGTPTLNGLGLVMDQEAQAAQEAGQLLDMAWARGHRMLVSVNYAMPEAAYSNPRMLRTSLEGNPHLAGQDVAAWDFEVAFRSPQTGVSFIRFEPSRARLGPAGSDPTRIARPGWPVVRRTPATPAPATSSTTRRG
ncbi:MAG: hypothetical protein CBC48_16860 [bacterium TMED88]|nr:hypothetical protein [Deltaproteobacteria bacterium]OUV25060.1 MAG: hypothetical protein CBC48_16860 [bacterium TMED88]